MSPKILFWCWIASLINKAALFVQGRIGTLSATDPDLAWHVFDGQEEER